MTSKTEDKPSGELATATERTLAAFRDMALLLPEASTEDGSVRIIEQIMQASSLDELDSVWGTDDAEELIGVWQEIQSAERSISTMEGSLGIFLIVRGVRTDTGESVVWTTGSTSIVAQIVKAYALGAMPFVARIVKAEKASSNGFFPQHLEIAKD